MLLCLTTLHLICVRIFLWLKKKLDIYMCARMDYAIQTTNDVKKLNNSKMLV